MTASTPEARLAAAGFILPEVSRPQGSYAPYCAVQVDGSRWVSIAGQVCRRQGIAMAGQCQSDDDLEPARRAAEVSMLNALAALRGACDGQLSRVVQLVRLRGFIRAAPEFTRHPAVLDAASAVLRTAFPDQPLPARSALGVASLPDLAWTEIEIDAVVANA
ncbi:RidA family protein [Cupriavidus agavae]|uniref:Enamine deaminase RidA (YjgF/YER057c/UK114 family) n=1 Tax=Cupriavidus agavae TaxID=1001822 RepID=A0A4Q7S9J0_9BURK|nr:RidA family protein [Cupriavidus agavae]RZT42132.1 enamine deaminase RidA (YjgF/YER057c/UK114 family) [Cupriavidus agavae]